MIGEGWKALVRWMWAGEVEVSWKLWVGRRYVLFEGREWMEEERTFLYPLTALYTTDGSSLRQLV